MNTNPTNSCKIPMSTASLLPFLFFSFKTIIFRLNYFRLCHTLNIYVFINNIQQCHRFLSFCLNIAYIYIYMLLWKYFLINIMVSRAIHDDNMETVQLNFISEYYSNIQALFSNHSLLGAIWSHSISCLFPQDDESNLCVCLYLTDIVELEWKDVS